MSEAEVSARVEDALASYKENFNGEALDHATAVDLLSDLMYWAEYHDYDWSEMLVFAEAAYEKEVEAERLVESWSRLKQEAPSK